MTTTTTVKSDIEIAQEASMKKIQEIAADLNILEDELEPYGHYKGKLSLDIFKRLQDGKDGKVVLVTAINPTPAGEGKSTVTVGLGQAFNKIGKKTVIALREPSLGPTMGLKGGARVAVFHKSYQWKTLTFTLLEISMRSQLPITH